VEGIPGRQTHDYKTPRHHHAARRAGDRHRQGDRRHPRITLHFTPTSGSWLDMVEIFFGIITRQAIRRGSFSSVKDLIDTIRRFIDGYNDRCQPFTWTKDAETILAKAKRSPKIKDEALT
jgi:DDE superfamily endonuclease